MLASAGAPVFQWKTPDGRIHLSDSMPPDAVRLGYRVIDGSTGRVMREVAAAKTPDQIENEAKLALSREATEAEEAKKKGEESAFLARYPDMEAIHREESSEKKKIEDQIKSLESQISSDQNSLSPLAPSKVKPIQERISVLYGVLYGVDPRYRDIERRWTKVKSSHIN